MKFLILFLFPLLAFGKVGKIAPNFELKGHDGKTYELSDFKGKHVVLEWFNKDCPFVKKHYISNNMQTLQGEFTEKGVVWLSIVSSAPGKQGHLTPNKAKEILKNNKSKATALLIDSDGKVGKAFSAKTTPHMYVIGPEGKFIYTGAIDSNPSTDPDDIKSSKNYVKMALEDSFSGKEVKVKRSRAYGCGVKY